MHAYRSLTTQRLLDVDARLASMVRTRAVVERRLVGEVRALRLVLVLWALTLAGIAGWVAG